ncbi:DEAD/DEAH box helicase [Variovorax sp. WS11]|uniref:type I restriction endonuclease subunit R n=1 Tax=Variovorax sp. WS11 TaxID=1105204 RepID=UPI000D0D4BAD|nr:HsdR family type I site-specific deoxyribonuclease [Variovorax sp. WS11]NDZ13665.1 type I restriction endonuclease subunit R [Variovorax sp. WS11]PSL79495.1 DEAD/DEAH box helicase [Variovorax sp. WS11]
MIITPPTREQSSAKFSALRMLFTLGWNYLSTADCLTLRGSTREVLLKPRLIEVLQTRRFDYKGEAYHLSPSAIDQILRELSTVGLGEGLLTANERLYAKLAYGITVTEFMPDGRRHQPTIHVIDWMDPNANRFDVTEALHVVSTRGTHECAPDIVGYVNGIPLVVIEARQPHGRHGANPAEAMVLEGIGQQLLNQRDDEIPHLFVYAQLLLSISEADARYGTTTTPERFWAHWALEEEFDDAHVLALKNAPLPAASHALFESRPATVRAYFESSGFLSMPPNDQDRLMVSLLTRERLLELMRGFVVFDSRIGKIVARHQQFFAVRALLACLSGQRPDGAREGGVIWHTTGSGKSFTMVFLTKALLLHYGLKECRLVVITDRRDLEQQLARNFMAGGAFGSSIATHKEGEHSKAASGRDLARRIGQGTKRITFALVQKFNTASRLAECRNDSPNVVVLVDEGHRSHGGETHERMKKALPRAAYVAFTGTPLLKDEKTAQKFGPIIHAYTMQRAVEDHAVAPLLYEERVPELSIDTEAVDRWFDGITTGLAEAQRADLKKKYARSVAIHGAAKRIELIAWDIATHFHQNFKKIGSSLKGQVATASKADAIRYKKALDATGLVTSMVVISPPEMREGDAGIDEGGMPEVQKWWQQNMLHQGVDTSHHERQVLQDFGTDGDPDLLIVVDRLLTGFDEPRNAVLYIDKPLKGHNLIQAVARVNRLHDAKRYGLLVDYRGILKELDTAIRAYQDLEARTQGGFDIGDLEGLYAQLSTEYRQLSMRHEAVWSFFKGVANRKDPEQLRQALSPRVASDGEGREYDRRQKLRDDFYAALTAFGLCLQTALSSRGFFEDQSFSEASIEQYKADLRTLIQVRQTARRDAGGTVDYSEYDEQIRRLVDDQVVGTNVREVDGAYVVHKLVAPDVSETWSQDKARNEADLIKTRLRKTIEQDLADDPYAQKVFSEMLQGAIAQAEAMFDHPRRQFALFREFEREVGKRATPGMPELLAHNGRARAYYGAILMALSDGEAAALDEARRNAHVQHALAISAVVQNAVAEHSLSAQSIEAAIRKGLLQLLYAPLGLDQANDVIARVLQMTRIGLGQRA